jgi:hypothetical protein
MRSRMADHKLRFVIVSAAAGAAMAMACSSTSTAPPDAAPMISLGDGGLYDAVDPGRAKPMVEGGYEGPDSAVIRADRFVTKVVSFTPGDCAGFGLADMPAVVLGPPVGGGAYLGSLDVVSFGVHGEIVLSFEPNAIVDGPGADFVVFENSFWAGGDPLKVNAELGEVSVSDDGATWKTFACAPASAPPYGACASAHVIYSAPGGGISPVDPARSGGDPYDLADVGMTHARYVRIRDIHAGAGTISCPTDPPKPTTAGFDLDAVALVNAEIP